MQHTILSAPTAEMRRWADRLAPLLEPGSWLGTALVTPIAHFANGSLEFQAYLYRVFHRSRAARTAHTAAMPGIVLAALALLASVHPALGAVAGVGLSAWYVFVGMANRLPLLAATGGTLGLALTAAGVAWGVHAGAGAPLAAVIGLGLVQTLSHAAEPDVPPRVSGARDWVRARDFFARGLPSFARATAMVIPGLVNELWASWRLLPVVLLDALWSAGYAPERARAIRDLVRDATRDGNPAIHFIGTGGACTAPYP